MATYLQVKNAVVSVVDDFTDDDVGENYGSKGKKLYSAGARYLALLWDSAWAAGGGSGVAASELGEREPKAIRKRYISTGFVKSVTLDEIEKHLVMSGPPSSQGKP